MQRRKVLLAPGEIYHVYNRGIARMHIFSSKSNYFRFLELVNYYRFVDTPLSYSHFKNLPIDQRSEIWRQLHEKNNSQVEIFAFCLMPNHYHFLVKQITDNGIAIWMSNIQNGYAKYYNVCMQRTGPLFQPRFQAVRIETEEQLIHTSRYIHINPSTAHLISIENLLQYPWSSLQCYIGSECQYSFVTTGMVLNLSGGIKNYEKFVYDQAAYQRELAIIKHLTFE